MINLPFEGHALGGPNPAAKETGQFDESISDSRECSRHECRPIVSEIKTFSIPGTTRL